VAFSGQGINLYSRIIMSIDVRHGLFYCASGKEG